MKRRRLESLDRFLETPSPEQPSDDHLSDLAGLVHGEILTAGDCRILRLVDEIDIFPYSAIKDIDAHCLKSLYRPWHFSSTDDDHEIDPGSLLFFDTETTGLSGGAGMVIFLCGFGEFRSGRFVLTQYFLPDYPDEPFFLECLKSHFTSETTLVSYNGKAFDWPFLSERYAFHRLDLPLYADHIDALFAARSLFRRLGPDCTLISLEKNVLHFDRGEDIPGYLIPAKYFDYLYDRQPGQIPDIIRHNRLDVISLALVMRYIAEYLTRPEAVTSAPLLEGVVSRFFRQRRYERLVKFVSKTGAGYLDECTTIGLFQYSLALKRLGQLEAARSVWENAAKSRDEPHVYHHLLELAKYHEHREKDFATALATVDLLEALAESPRQKRGVERRRQRLEKKLARVDSKSL